MLTFILCGIFWVRRGRSRSSDVLNFVTLCCDEAAEVTGQTVSYWLDLGRGEAGGLKVTVMSFCFEFHLLVLFLFWSRNFPLRKAHIRA